MQKEIDRDILYVSDLDGTLLQKDGTVSNKTVEILNGLMNRGLRFTVATARSPASAADILKPLKLQVPLILMNGVFLFDKQEDRYVHMEQMREADVKEILEFLKPACRQIFVFTMEPEQKLCVHHKPLCSEKDLAFYGNKNKYYKTFYENPSYCLEGFGPAVYLSVTDRENVILPLYEKVRKQKGVSAVVYSDVYHEGYWYLEIFSVNAGKVNGIRKVQKLCGTGRVVVFGDNYNDAEMFDAADVCYAVQNAVPEIREKANGVIGSNTDNGVALYLQELFE